MKELYHRTLGTGASIRTRLVLMVIGAAIGTWIFRTWVGLDVEIVGLLLSYAYAGFIVYWLCNFVFSLVRWE